MATHGPARGGGTWHRSWPGGRSAPSLSHETTAPSPKLPKSEPLQRKPASCREGGMKGEGRAIPVSKKNAQKCVFLGKMLKPRNTPPPRSCLTPAWLGRMWPFYRRKKSNMVELFLLSLLGHGWAGVGWRESARWAAGWEPPLALPRKGRPWQPQAEWFPSRRGRCPARIDGSEVQASQPAPGGRGVPSARARPPRNILAGQCCSEKWTFWDPQRQGGGEIPKNLALARWVVDTPQTKTHFGSLQGGTPRPKKNGCP